MDWEAHGSIGAFTLGRRDVSHRLVISEQLYGRERDIRTLQDAFNAVLHDGNPRMVVVSGYSGVGKSSLVHELQKSLVPSRSLFASGKFDQYKRDIPYATLAQAFQTLTRRILANTDSELLRWRSSLSSAMGSEAQLIVSLIPELESIVGQQPEVIELPAAEAQARFQSVFRRFLGVFAQGDHPLVLFLDDLQWLDAATLTLLEHLLTSPDVRHVLIVGAYRDNEVTPSHPLATTLRNLRSMGARLHEVALHSLTPEAIAQIVASALRTDMQGTTDLAAIVHSKSGGNPFFTIQFLTSLAEEGLLAFDHVASVWQWNAAAIRAKGFTDNVIDLMIVRLGRLPAWTLELLKQIACLGDSADVRTLAALTNTDEQQIHAALWDAVVSGLVIRAESGYSFLHDRVQEAAYALIADADRAPTHLRIARSLLGGMTPKALDDQLFEVVNQFNRSIPLIDKADEQRCVAELNLRAGLRAKTSAAYASARSYFAAGSALLEGHGWQSCRDLTFSIEMNLGECDFLVGELLSADERLTLLSARAWTHLQTATVAWWRITIYTAMDRSPLAVRIGIDYLRAIDICWSPEPTADEVHAEYSLLRHRLREQDLDILVDRPVMTDARQSASLDILMAMLPPAVYTNKQLVLLVLCRMANLSIQHGNTDASSVGYAYLGMYLGPTFNDYAGGYDFAKLGLGLVEHRGLSRFKARVYMTFGYHVLPWTKPLDEGTFPLLRQTLEAANDSADLNYVGYYWYCLVAAQLTRGLPLVEVQRSAETGLAFVTKTNFGLLVAILSAQLAFIRALRGSTREPGCLDGPGFDATNFESQLGGNPSLTIAAVMYWIRQLQIRYFSGNYEGAVSAAERAESLIRITDGHLEIADFYFYASLARAALAHHAKVADREEHLEKLSSYLQQLDIWAAACPENWGNRALLVAAEIARLEERHWDAQCLYEEAIASARLFKFVQNEGIGLLVASRFYKVRGFATTAKAYAESARACFQRWGAEGAAHRLDICQLDTASAEGALEQASFVNGRDAHIDLSTVVKVSQAVTGELELDKLLRILMTVAVENAGAERAVLILKRGDDLRIEADATTSTCSIDVQLRHGPASFPSVPESIVRYVARTHDSLLLNDASRQTPYSEDTYVLHRRARSVLCLPLLKLGNLVGVLYLENKLVPGAFTARHAAVLDLIASQAAVSLENAMLYAELQLENAERTRAEDGLRRVQAYLDEAQTLSRTGSFGWNVITGGMAWSAATYSLMGVDQSVSPTLEYAYSIVHPDDIASVRNSLEIAASQQMPLDYEHRLLMKDGTVRHVHVVARPLTPDSGSFEYVGAIMDVTQRKRAEALSAGEKRLLEMIARSESLAVVLNAVCRLFEDTVDGSLCTILFTDPKTGRTWHASAPSVAQEYANGMDRAIVSMQAHPFTTVPSPGQPRNDSDIASDARWRPFRSLALEHNLRACWSWPIHSLEGRQLGVLAVYFRDSITLTPYHQSLAEQFLDIVSIVLNRTQVEEARLEERVNERTRIARELHDTLLQSFQGLMLRFQTVGDLLPGNPENAKRTLEGILQRADRAIAEGRDAVQGLRDSSFVTSTLAAALVSFGAELAIDCGRGIARSPSFDVKVAGTPQQIELRVQDEVYRIAREAMRNAFVHSNARSVEAEICYSEEYFRLRLRDDGAGINAATLKHGGRAGHWGLVGMRERALRIGAALDVRSRIGAGTEIELRIPGYTVYLS
ncbi:MAG: AAA family ATPase [Steroidobacteraceae bacterium]